MPDAEIVSIYGYNADPRKASARVVEALEQQLEKARSGETVAISIAFIHFDGSSGRLLAGTTGGCPQLIGETFCLMQDMANS
jgi:hypothetical protein